MTDGDTDSEKVEEESDETHMVEEETGDDTSNDGDEGDEEASVSVSFTVREALVVLHLAWEKELEGAESPKKMGIATVMSGVSTKLGEEVYNDEVAEWMKEQRQEQENMMEQLENRMSDMAGGMSDTSKTSRTGFQ